MEETELNGVSLERFLVVVATVNAVHVDAEVPKAGFAG